MGDFLFAAHNVIGVIGVFFVLSAYFFMQVGRVRHDGIFSRQPTRLAHPLF